MLFTIFFSSCSTANYFRADGTCPGSKKSCYDYCLLESKDEYVCLSLTTIRFCYDFRSYFFIIWACFVLPVIISFICSCICCRKFRPPFLAIFLNLLIGTYWSIAIMGIYCIASTDSTEFIPIIIFPLFFTLAVCCISSICGCQGCKPKNDPKFIHQMMIEKCLEKDEFENYVNTILRGPPVIHLKGGIHYSFRRGKSVTSFTIPFQQAAPYVSWEERSPILHVSHNKYMLVKTKLKFKYTKELKDYIHEMKKDMTTREIENGAEPENISIETEQFVDGMKPFLMATGKGKVPRFHKFTSSCFGKFLWFFLSFLGLSTVYESIYCAGVKRVKVKSVKYISSTPCFHCPAYEYDDGLQFVEYGNN
ncbi:hypothetical protein GPJ56_008776 [Histomonas meleagridis]|uniref:uncharacterized protein n=1 Tax=Histomonas meleagridis TaxID=135588 RepID=UPI00355A2F69|nr:hypothetical protein GPJ56_008776 [Histomonas meleagridis]KAH0805432.1 hypothetical protein GO595_001814 [Histomonas meleagridis]